MEFKRKHVCSKGTENGTEHSYSLTIGDQVIGWEVIYVSTNPSLPVDSSIISDEQFSSDKHPNHVPGFLTMADLLFSYTDQHSRKMKDIMSHYIPKDNYA